MIIIKSKDPGKSKMNWKDLNFSSKKLLKNLICLRKIRLIYKIFKLKIILIKKLKIHKKKIEK
jgi:hypothetical protein